MSFWAFQGGCFSAVQSGPHPIPTPSPAALHGNQHEINMGESKKHDISKDIFKDET